MAVLGVFSSICAMAARGNTVALGVAVAIVGLVVPFGIFALAYCLLLAVAQLSLTVGRHVPLAGHEIEGLEK